MMISKLFCKAAILLVLCDQVALGVQEEKIPLAPEDVVSMVITDNPSVKSARLQPTIARYDFQEAEGMYDPALHAAVTLDRDESGSNSVFFDDTTTTQGVLGISKYFATGTYLSLDWTNEITSTDSAFALFETAHTNRLELSMRQPLLRNFAGEIHREVLHRLQIEISRMDLQAQDNIEAELHAALAAYWRWTAAGENRQLVLVSLEKAGVFFETTRENHQLGTAEDAELLAAQAQVARRKLQLDGWRETEESAKRALFEHINPGKTLNWRPAVTLSEPPEMPALEGLLERALETRRDIRMAYMGQTQAVSSVSASRNNRLPNFDLVAGFGTNGIDDGYGHAFADMAGIENPHVSIGLDFSWTLGNRENTYAYRKALLEQEYARLAIQRLELAIQRQARDVVANLNWQISRTRQLDELRKTEAQKLSSEQKQFDRGRSSSDQVLRYQDDVILAKIDYAAALLDLHLAVLDARRVDHSLLDFLIKKAP